MKGITLSGGGVGVVPARRSGPRMTRPTRGDAGPLRNVVQGREAVVVRTPPKLRIPKPMTRHRDHGTWGPYSLEAVEIVEKHFQFGAPDGLRIATTLAPHFAAFLRRTSYPVDRALNRAGDNTAVARSHNLDIHVGPTAISPTWFPTQSQHLDQM